MYYDYDKVKKLALANEKLNICDDTTVAKNKTLVFVYCPPKVGSTTLVTSLRLCALEKLTVLHIHDEKMIEVLCGVQGVTVNEIIDYNKVLGKDVFVIDVFRTPIEHAISIFFEKVSSLHFNNTENMVNGYDVQKVICRFNRIFPHLARTDYYKEVYAIPPSLIPDCFDFQNKYLRIHTNGVTFIKLRLSDSNSWGTMLGAIFGITVTIVSDYETKNKPIAHLFRQFNDSYRVPQNLLPLVENSDALNYYFSPFEVYQYISKWKQRTGGPFQPFSDAEYKLYMEVSIENRHISEVQRNHYIDVGCACKACSLKRNQIVTQINSGHKVTDTVNHEQATHQYRITRRKQKLADLNKKMSEASVVKPTSKRVGARKIIASSFDIFAKR